jgi:hypothetical protein
MNWAQLAGWFEPTGRANARPMMINYAIAVTSSLISVSRGTNVPQLD